MKGLLMFTSIDDVSPIDSNEVGDSIADFLQTTGQIALITTAALFVACLIFAIVIAKKAGYSGWWGALAVVVPPLGVLLTLLFVFLKWPALKQRDEALGILKANDLTLPSQERAAIKEAERKQQIEDDARRRMERAQVDREKAEADREKFREAQARDAAARVAAANAAAAATPALEAKPDAEPSAAKPAAEPSSAEPDFKPAAEPSAAERDTKPDSNPEAPKKD